jgi:hypothetical protein
VARSSKRTSHLREIQQNLIKTRIAPDLPRPDGEQGIEEDGQNGWGGAGKVQRNHRIQSKLPRWNQHCPAHAALCLQQS